MAINIEVTSQEATRVEVIAPSEIRVFASNIPIAAGPVGPQGVQGPQGPSGEKGDQGNSGPMGIQGFKGDTGEQGEQGVQGLKGDKGDTGNTGSTGATGATGATGPNGPQGIQGVKGDTGNTGATGSQGIQGLKGDKGDTGNTGLQGPKGDTGNTGATGAQGLQGIQGIAGPEGPQGIQGNTGSQGQAGASVTLKGSVANVGSLPSSGNTLGDSYINDADGNLYVWTGSTWHDAGQIVGPEGPQGPQGIQGIQGEAGTNGTNGTNGAAGEAGQAGTILSAPLTYQLNMSTLVVGTEFTIPYVGNGGFAVGSVITLTDANNYYNSYSRIFALIVDVNQTTITLLPTTILNPQTITNWILTISGQRGATGNTGATGPAGSAGATGAKGDTGDTGPQGVAGAVGPQGPQGLTGNTGATGAEGPQGIQGLTGATGPAGTNGTNGTAATVTVGTTTTGATAAVTNSGTSSAAVLNFVLPTSGGGGSSTNPIYSQISNGLEFFDDFFNLVTSSRPIPILTSTSGASNSQFANTTGTNRIGQLYQNVVNPGRVAWADVLGVSQDNYIKTFQCRTKVNQLIGAVSNESFVVQIGGRYTHYNTAYNANGPMACFVYDPLLTNAYSGTGATASPNWQIATGWNSNLTGTDVTFHNTGIPVDTNYHTFKTVLTPAGTSIIIDYYYDGTLIHTRTIANYGGFAQLGHGVSIYKNSGINFNINVETDYIYLNFKPSFAR